MAEDSLGSRILYVETHPSLHHTDQQLVNLEQKSNEIEEYQILIEQETPDPLTRPFMCPICDKGFTRKGDMLRHHRKHTGEKPFSCPECADEFSRKDDMVRHLRGHQGIKPHQCPVCKRKFGRKTDMVKHLLVHAGIKACGCPTCGCPFSHKGKGSRKTCAFSSSTKIFCCPSCEDTFLRKRDLMQHYQINHVMNMESDNKECYSSNLQNLAAIEVHAGTNDNNNGIYQQTMEEEPEEGRNSDSSSQNQDPRPNTHELITDLQDRMPKKAFAKMLASPKKKKMNLRYTKGGAAKPFECPECGDTFSRKADMQRHLNLHSGVKPYQCPAPLCLRAFSRKDDQMRHTLTHQREKPFPCNICGKGFIRKTEFATHMLNHSSLKKIKGKKSGPIKLMA